MYNKQYLIYDLDDLEILTEIADYYCALKIVSRTLDGPIFSVFLFARDIVEDPVRGLVLAHKLRNALLYRECLILSQGPWYKPAFWSLICPEIPDPSSPVRYDVLFKRALNLNHNIYALIGKATEAIYKAMRRWKVESPEKHKERFEFMQRAQENATTSIDASVSVTGSETDTSNAPQYFRQLHDYTELMAQPHSKAFRRFVCCYVTACCSTKTSMQEPASLEIISLPVGPRATMCLGTRTKRIGSTLALVRRKDY